jgi:hypothetical protein
MTGPELDHELEAIGRRLSPRVGAAHDAVVARATGGEAGRRPRTALPRPGRLGGAVVTLAFTAGFAALLAVGVANRPAGPTPATSANGPAVALATGPAAPAASGSPAGVPPTRDATPAPAPVVPAPTVTVPPPAPATTAPAVAVGAATTGRPAPPTQAPPPRAVATAPPSDAPGPSDRATPTQDPGPQPSPAPPPTMTSAPNTGRAPMRIVLTEKDSGRTITVHRGDLVEVDLSAPQQQPGWRWTEPQSTDETVAHRTSGAARNDGSADAVFGAAGDGNARVYASRMPACYFSTPRCYPPVAIDFQVTIVVTG